MTSPATSTSPSESVVPSAFFTLSTVLTVEEVADCRSGVSVKDSCESVSFESPVATL